ncbi:hypothetical protein MGWOODY_XGa1326 [hydrothermal vent metagenome]|uniref:Uncharacterized protein n=1 Tax=hydrothermal vent metagenome TaxID=652676 RepID=A0A160TV88_9ZZZZ
MEIGSSVGARGLDLSAHFCDADCHAYQYVLLRFVRRRRPGLPHLKFFPALR